MIKKDESLESYLYRSTIFYLQRYSTSQRHLRDVLWRKIRGKEKFMQQYSFEEVEEKIQETLFLCLEKNYLDDCLYARGIIFTALKRGESFDKIYQKLFLKKVNQKTQEDAFQDVLQDLYGNIPWEDRKNEALLSSALTYAKKKHKGPWRKVSSLESGNDAHSCSRRQCALGQGELQEDQEQNQKDIQNLIRQGFPYAISKQVISGMTKKERENKGF